MPVSSSLPAFSYAVTVDRIIQITELDHRRPVARAMVAILADITRREGHDLSGYQVIYRDSIGIWDAVQLDAGGTFEHFYPLNETTQAIALRLVRGMFRLPVVAGPLAAAIFRCADGQGREADYQVYHDLQESHYAETQAIQGPTEVAPDFDADWIASKLERHYPLQRLDQLQGQFFAQ